MKNKINPRIIAGEYKNRKLLVPDSARPITDRVKRTMFDILGDITELECLDLFSGSGSVGIECLSRGAKFVTFIDNSYEAISLLKTNLENLSIPSNRYEIKQAKIDKNVGSKLGKTYDLVLLDPPFKLIDSIPIDGFTDTLQDSGILIFKSNNDSVETAVFKVIESRTIGINTIFFLSKNIDSQ